MEEGICASDIPALFAAHHAGLVKYAARHLGPDRAEDVAQDAWVRAFQALQGQARIPPAAAKAWRSRIVANLVKDAQRHQQVIGWFSLETLPEPAGSAAALEQQAADREEIRRALAVLTPASRAILSLILSGYSYVEISQQSAWSEDRLKTRMYRARQQLARWQAAHERAN